jgi:hypothetical protein
VDALPLLQCAKASSCSGSGLQHRGRACLRHLDGEALADELQAYSASGQLDARRNEITNSLLRKIVRARETGIHDVRFDGARFDADATLANAHFSSTSSFAGASFSDRASFSHCIFDQAHFEGTTFGANANFSGCQLGDHSSFSRAVFGAHAVFNGSGFGDATRLVETRFGDQAGFNGVTFGVNVSFGQSRFDGRSSFSHAVFGRNAQFGGVVFTRLSAFSHAEFGDGVAFVETNFNCARFSDAIFNGSSRWARARFGRSSALVRARFGGQADFNRAVFAEAANLANVVFDANAIFSLCTFAEGLSFAKASFRGRAIFTRAQVAGRATFARAQFADANLEGVRSHDVSFARTSFDSLSLAGYRADSLDFFASDFGATSAFGPVTVRRGIRIDGCLFPAPVQIEVDAKEFLSRWARYESGATMRLGTADVVLDNAHFGRASLITRAATRDRDFHDRRRTARPIQEHRQREWREPRVISIRGADVNHLTLADVDLRACHFAGAHNLDALKIEGASRFCRSPPGAARRRTITEEHLWRSSRRVWRARRWSATGGRAPAHLLPLAAPLDPHQLVRTYRALRKGLEDTRDAPGAADFYYGEMEMRRFSEETPWVERRVLDVYWLVSGYGLRASRSLAALVMLIVGFALFMRRYGFVPRKELFGLVTVPVRPSFTSAVLQTIEGATRVVGRNQGELTSAGQIMEAVLRVLGAILLGLSLLAVRARVKR